VKTVRHIARAAASTGAALPAYRADIQVRSHELIADEPIELGGGDLGPSPFGLLASALAACTAITLRMYAARKGWDLTAIDVEVRCDLDDDDALSMARHITLPGDLTDEQRERFGEMAERTPVTRAIRGETPITTTFT
jgi:putative redox protein